MPEVHLQLYAHQGVKCFAVSCAVCHGATGQGNGPAAFAFTKPPANLTMLAKNNNGKYPAQRVHEVLKFGTHVLAHGNIQMPVWNTLFHSMGTSPEANDQITIMRIDNLVEYIRGIQAK